MEASRTEERGVAPGRADGVLWWLIAGVPVGLLFLIAVQLDTRWFVFLFLGILVFAASFAPVERKAFYLALLVLTIPIKIDLHLYFQKSNVHHSTHGFLLLLHYLPLAALYVIWAGRSLSGHRSADISTRGLGPLAAFFGAGVISVFLGGNALFGSFDLFALLGSIALFVYASSELRTRRYLRIVVVALFVAVLVQGVIAVGQHLTRSSLGLGFLGAYTALELRAGLATLTRVGGTIGHPNALARFFDLLIPLGFSLLFCPLHRRTKFLLGAAVGVGMVGLVLTLSRGGLVATGVGCLLIFFVWLKRRIGPPLALSAATLAIVLVVALVFGTSNLVQQRFFQDDYKAAFGRIPLMRVALNMIRDHPFFGVGLNNYSEVAPRYDNTPQRVTAVWNLPVHNLFLYIVAQTGLVGLVCYLLFLLSILRALRPALGAPDPFVAWAGFGILVGMAAFISHVQIEFDSVTRNSMFWFVSGLAVSVGRLAALPDAERAH